VDTAAGSVLRVPKLALKGIPEVRERGGVCLQELREFIRGPATDAQLNHPFGLAVTADGGFLIADTFNQVVRKVEPIG
jgi:hypothetical protein